MKQEIIGYVIWNAKGKFRMGNKIYTNIPAARGALTLMCLEEGVVYRIVPAYANLKDMKNPLR